MKVQPEQIRAQNHQASSGQVDPLIMLQVGQEVEDRWFKNWGTGKCVKALKSRWHIKFSDGETRVFDRDHLQFLKAI